MEFERERFITENELRSYIGRLGCSQKFFLDKVFIDEQIGTVGTISARSATVRSRRRSHDSEYAKYSKNTAKGK